MYKYPVYQPYLKGNEKKYVLDCLDSNWISSKGKYVDLFERQTADYLGVKHATGVCNGTVALHLALVSLGIGKGDEVIVPTLTYIAPVNAITYTGAEPVFVDSVKKTWQMDPEDIRASITNATKAILVVHVYGHPCDMNAIMKIANDYDLFVIEDAAEAFGSRYEGKPLGTFGNIATFSFYGNKTITTGEGGMVVTNDETLYDRIIHFKGQGLAKYRQYWHDVVGYNYRMTNICAAIGLAQLEQLENILRLKRELVQNYIKFLPKEVDYHKEQEDTFHSYWIFTILVEHAKDRDSLREHLVSNGIETRPMFYPVHTMPMYSQKYQQFKVAENLGWRGINLPSYPGLGTEDIQFICRKIEEYFLKKGL